MTTLTYTVPTAGSTLNSVADPEIATALNAILSWSTNIDGTNVVASLTGRRLIMQASVLFGAGVTASGYFPTANGGTVIQAGSTSQTPVWAYLDPANYAVTGKTNTQLIVRMSVAANANAPSQNFLSQLVPVTFSGSTGGSITVTGGTAISGSATSVLNPSASTAGVVETSPFAFPAAGAYVLGINVGGTTAVNSTTIVTTQLFVLNS